MWAPEALSAKEASRDRITAEYSDHRPRARETEVEPCDTGSSSKHRAGVGLNALHLYFEVDGGLRAVT